MPVAAKPLLALPALLLLVAPMPTASAAPVCPPDNGNVWFLGVVYDATQRNDFVLEVDNFEFYLSTLRQTYCIPDSQAKILAFENNWTRNGKTYPAATEGAVKAELAAMGAAASLHPDSIFFYFQSSHGNVYAINVACPGGARALGSYAALRASPNESGTFLDCELGHALNSNFASHVRMFIAVDCSFCGGFSDSLTAASGTLEDDEIPRSSGVPGPNRVVMTGCAITTECFGSNGGGVSFKHLKRALTLTPTYCDGYSAAFPDVQGVNAPAKLHALDGKCTASEWFFAAVASAYTSLDVIGIQQQFRIKYGMPDLASDLVIR
jgi:hypothetical protein